MRRALIVGSLALGCAERDTASLEHVRLEGSALELRVAAQEAPPAAAPQASASAQPSEERCVLPTPSPPKDKPKSGGAALHASWIDAEGECVVPDEYRPWSWGMLNRVTKLRRDIVVLTVDGGHSIETTHAGLDVLREYGVHATYFITTSELQGTGGRGAELIQRIAAEGHEIANHSDSHPHLTKLSDKGVRGQVLDADTWLTHVLGFSPRPFFRPPFLDHDERVGRILKELCYRPVWFTVYSRDDERDITSNDIAEAVLCEKDGRPRDIKRGSILMFHASQRETVKAWPIILTGLRERGFEILPLGEAMRAREGKRKRSASREARHEAVHPHSDP